MREQNELNRVVNASRYIPTYDVVLSPTLFRQLVSLYWYCQLGRGANCVTNLHDTMVTGAAAWYGGRARRARRSLSKA